MFELRATTASATNTRRIKFAPERREVWSARSYALLQRLRVRTPWIYVPLALVSWVAVHTTGIHATINGVALGLLTRVRRDPGEPEAPAVRLTHRLQPWSAALGVPVFALFAAGIDVDGGSLGMA